MVADLIAEDDSIIDATLLLYLCGVFRAIFSLTLSTKPLEWLTYPGHNCVFFILIKTDMSVRQLNLAMCVSIGGKWDICPLYLPNVSKCLWLIEKFDRLN